MPSSSLSKFDCFVENVAEKVHNLGSDALKIEFTNVAPVVTNTVIANITECAFSATGGYSAGGVAVTISSSAQTSGTYKLILADQAVTPTGGSVGPFRYAVLYNSTAAGGPLIGWWDYGSSITLNAGETLNFDFDNTNGIFTIA